MAYSEVHVGDVGTRYLVPVKDDGVFFDPSDANVKQLIFKMPGGGVVVKDADEIVVDGSPATTWHLAYQVKESDVLGSPPGDFHTSKGPLRIQAYLEWTDGSRFSSSIAEVDTQGRALYIYTNLL